MRDQLGTVEHFQKRIHHEGGTQKAVNRVVHDWVN